MCGIFGIVDYKNKMAPEKRVQILRVLGVLNEARGTDATGFGLLMKDGKKKIYKADTIARNMDYDQVKDAIVILGHTRQGTIGGKTALQAHPFTYRGYVQTHNGVGYKDHADFKWAQGESGVDSETMLRYFVYSGGASKDGILKFTKDWSTATYAMATLTDDNRFISFRDGNPFNYVYTKDGAIVYSSNPQHLRDMIAMTGFEVKDFDKDGDPQVWYYEEHHFLEINTKGEAKIEEYKAKKEANTSYTKTYYPHGGNYENGVHKFGSHRGGSYDRSSSTTPAHGGGFTREIEGLPLGLAYGD